MSRCTSSSWKRRPIKRLIANKVLFGLVTAWRFAGEPTKISPSSVNATTDGVVRSPSPFSITRALPPSSTATQEFVVPKSIPIVLPMIRLQLQIHEICFVTPYLGALYFDFNTL